MDRGLRGLLALPGTLLEAWDGRVRAPDPEDSASLPLLAAQVRATAVHPEAYLMLEDGLHRTHAAGCVTAWAHRGRTAFAIGGINAPPAQRLPLLRAFSEQARAAGCVRRLVFPVRPHEQEAVRQAGYGVVQVGIEANVPLAEFTLRGKAFEHVRQMRNRAQSKGVVVKQVTPPSHGEAMAALHANWLASKRPSWRMKLLVGSPSLDRPFDRRYLAAEHDGRLEGFLTLLPGAEGVWGVDVMVRRPDAVVGTMELLVTTAALQLREEGAHTLALGPCPMAGVPFSWQRPMLTATFGMLYGSSLGNRIFGFRRLVSFKQKFRPTWTPVYLGASPHIGVLALYRGCRMWGLF